MSEDSEKSLSDVYGVEHLLRLFGERDAAHSLPHVLITPVKFPSILTRALIEKAVVSNLEWVLVDILHYMTQRTDAFCDVYLPTSKQYMHASGVSKHKRE